MSDESDNLPVNWPKHAASVANNFINKISKAVGTWYEPTHKRRSAKADAAAKKIVLESALESELQIRAFKRMMHEEERKQINMEAVIEASYEHIEDTAKPEQLDDDWLIDFFDKAKKISDKQMQALWGKVLAGETNTPGTYTKATLQTVALLEKADADLFATLCRFVVVVWDVPLAFVFDYKAPIYTDLDIHFDTLHHLDDLGLLSFDPNETVSRNGLPTFFEMRYGGSTFNCATASDFVLPVGHVVLTKTGEQLFGLSNAHPVDGFMDYLSKRWEASRIALHPA